jgi:hypothetical protein
MSFEGELIANTFNLYVDSERVGTGDQMYGDDFILPLGNNAISCGQGQYVRLTLNSFSMYKNFQDVNNNNNQLVFRDASGSSAVKMAVGNYQNRNQIALEMAKACLKGFVNIAVAQHGFANETATLDPSWIETTIPSYDAATAPFGLQPPPAGSASDTISFRLQFVDPSGNVVPNLLTGSPIIQMFQQDAVAAGPLSFTGGESFALLGGNKIRDNTDVLTSSVKVDVSTNYIDVQCFYPCQTSTCSYVYLRSDLQNTGIESANFDQPSAISINSTINSNILGRIPINTDFCQYDAMVGREYFLNIQSKHISQLRLFLTDNHNRPFGRGTDQFASQTAGGAIDPNTDTYYGTKQSTLGNLFFTAVIRVDVIQQRQVKELETPYPMNNIPARKVSNVLNPMNMNYKGSEYDAPQPVPYVSQKGRANPLAPENNVKLAEKLGVLPKPNPN